MRQQDEERRKVIEVRRIARFQVFWVFESGRSPCCLVKAARQENEDKLRRQKQYLKKRSVTRKNLMQRTKKGQPVLANHINHLLSKIKKNKS
jgi:hypothetical protein